MTLEQLMCPVVREWRKANRHLQSEQRLEEFYKWAEENIELINESVNNNIEHINEYFEKGFEHAKLLNESAIDDEEFWNKAIGVKSSKEEDKKKEVGTSSTTHKDDYTNVTLKGKRILDDSLTNSKSNVFSCVNTFYNILLEEGTNNDPNPEVWGNLDVSNVTNMTALFAFAEIKNADLSSWITSKVKTMEGMFYKSNFNNNSIENWKVESCDDFLRMFTFCDFKGNISNWKLKEILTPELDNSGNPIKLPNGKDKMVKSTVNPPLIGATANEESEILKAFWKDVIKDFRKKDQENKPENNEEKLQENMKMKYILDYETFINEGFGDFVRKGVNKIKSFFKDVTLKLGNYIASFDTNGKIIKASDPYTALNCIADGQVEGVSAYTNVKNEYLNDNVESTAKVIGSPEYYGIMDKDSIEYQNFITMTEMLNEHYSKYGDKLNEANGRIGFAGEGAGLHDCIDINSEDLIFYLEEIMHNTPHEKGADNSKPILIWGAPGIGKSSIPDSVIRAWNKNNVKKKTLMVVECGNLTVDGFSLPMPTTKKIGQYLKEQPLAKQDVIDKIGTIEKAIEEIEISISDDVVKSWLPVYKKTNDEKINTIMNAKCNGGSISEYVKGEDGKFSEKTIETTEGGIILFDEFFRANAQVFKILMQILLNRRFNNDMVLGDKWAIIACSNRPNDDDEVSDGYESTGAVIGTRFAHQYNFIPDFDEWKKWAINKGHFDEATLAFLQLKKEASTGEYTNWHTIKPNEYEKGKSGWPTPRTWSLLMTDLYNMMKNRNYDSIVKIPRRILEQQAGSAIGKSLGKEYVNFILSYYSNFNPSEMLNNPNYKIPEDIKISEIPKRLEGHIGTLEELPTDEQLMNMFDNLNKSITGSQNNILKPLYVFILEKLGIHKDVKDVYNRYRKFIMNIINKYGLMAKAPNKETVIDYSLENIQDFCNGELPRHETL